MGIIINNIINLLTLLQSADVPAPAQAMLSARYSILTVSLFATTALEVARVSDPRTTPFLKVTPQMVVPVFRSCGFVPSCWSNEMKRSTGYKQLMEEKSEIGVEKGCFGMRKGDTKYEREKASEHIPDTLSHIFNIYINKGRTRKPKSFSKMPLQKDCSYLWAK